MLKMDVCTSELCAISIRGFQSYKERAAWMHFAQRSSAAARTAGRFSFHVMASLAQMERELLVERTQAGLDAAKKRGRVGGRKRAMTDSKLRSAKNLLADGVPPKEVAADHGVSIPTLYRWIPASERDHSAV